MSELIGKELGSYRIQKQIGAGGMATVYKAYHAAMDRYVAVKVLPEQMGHDEQLRRRFQREARVIAKLEHAHILPVHDYGRAGNRLYLVMRYIEAGTLKDRLDAGTMDLSKVNQVIHQVGGALDYAHRLGVVHRDVKPSNVLLDAQGDCYLTDFGLARIMESSVKLTASGVGLGTPAYMSPEQGQGEKVDARSDIYSLGVMLYEMVTGRVPYEADTPMAVVLKHITAPLPLPSEVKPDVPGAVERVILKAMAKDPDDRFQTAGEMVGALDAAVRLGRAEIPPEIPPAEGFLARMLAGLRRAAQTGWGRTAMWTVMGAVVLLAFFLLLSQVPLKVQINGGRLEVLRVVEVTAMPETATPEPVLSTVEGATPTEAAAARVTAAMAATEEITPLPTASPSPTATHMPTSTPSPIHTPTATPTHTLTPTPSHTPTPTPTDISTPIPTLTPTPTHTPTPTPFLSVPLYALAVDPNGPDTIFAGTSGAGIYISRDSGQTWTPSNEGLGKGTVGSIVIDPNDSDIVYTALFDQGGVYKSTDGGRTWSVANQGINLDGAMDDTGLIYLDPTDSSRLYYSGTTNGLYHSSDGGATWQQRSGDCPSWFAGLAIDLSDGEHLYASTYGGPPGSTCLAGIYESHDGGHTWKWLTTKEMVAPSGDWWHLAADPRDFNILYAGGQRGTYRTSDGGQSWTLILDQDCDWLAASEIAIYCGRGGDLLISPDGGQSWEEVSFGLDWRGHQRRPFAIAPGDPQTLYAGADAVMKSTNGGWTWTRVGRLGAVARMRLTVDPRDGNRLFLNGVIYVSEVFRSEDRGRTWQIVATHGGWHRRLTIDPVKDVIYLPDTSGALYRSRDNGQTWERLGSGYLTPDVCQLVPDPRDAEGLWSLGDCGSRLSFSGDGGETFAMVESFPQDVCFPILLVDRDGRRVYVVAWEGFFRSDDGGETWRSLEGLGGIYRAAALDPSNPDVVYVGSTHKGVLKTTDGGHSWRQVNNGLTNPSTNELAIDPANPQTIYAATDGGAFVSVDGGESWSPIQEELGPNPIVYSIAVDPNDSSKVYAVTPDGIFQLAGALP